MRVILSSHPSIREWRWTNRQWLRFSRTCANTEIVNGGLGVNVCVHSETCMCLKMVLHSSAVMMPFRDRGPAKFCSEREQLLNQQLNTHFPSHNLVQSV